MSAPPLFNMDDDYAFPFQLHEKYFCPGMTLRDYFAAKAMQSAYLHFAGEADCSKHWTTDGIAKSAYAMADAMLEARSV